MDTLKDIITRLPTLDEGVTPDEMLESPVFHKVVQALIDEEPSAACERARDLSWTLVGVVREITPGGDEDFFYRARIEISNDDLTRTLASPAQELGPPPSCHASSGRMHAAGIAVFYGDMDRDTCIAEARASW